MLPEDYVIIWSTTRHHVGSCCKMLMFNLDDKRAQIPEIVEYHAVEPGYMAKNPMTTLEKFIKGTGLLPMSK